VEHRVVWGSTQLGPSTERLPLGAEIQGGIPPGPFGALHERGETFGAAFKRGKFSGFGATGNLLAPVWHPFFWGGPGGASSKNLWGKIKGVPRGKFWENTLVWSSSQRG